MGQPAATAHTPPVHTALRVKTRRDYQTLSTSKHAACRGEQRPDVAIRAPQHSPCHPKQMRQERSPNPTPHAPLCVCMSVWVSDRLIKDYNLPSSEDQRIGLAISNLIFFQVTAKLKFVLPNKIMGPICTARDSRFQ